MSKFGFDEKKTVHEKIYDRTVAHTHVPGRAFEVNNPSEKLIHIIGGGFFNEPRYYDTNRNYVDFAKEFKAQGKITSKILDSMGLTEQAREVIETMVQVAESDNPEDLLLIAAWARDTKEGLKLRTTPQIALVIAAAHAKTKCFVRKYSKSIMKRLDEVRQVFAAFRHLFQQSSTGMHKGTLPHSLRKGIAEVLSTASLYEILKYNSDEKPTLKDVLLMVSGSKKLPNKKSTGWPLSKAVFQYIVNGVLTQDAPETLRLRDEFFKLKDVMQVTPEYVEKAALTWENIISHFGSTKETWEMCIPLMGEMALTRNLRNFEKVGISKEYWDMVYSKFDIVTNTVQLPFRFFTAYQQTTSTEAKSIVAMQLDKAVAGLPELKGITVVFSDNSGSAQGAVISGKSDIRVADCGNMLEAIVAKRMGRNARIGVFGDSFIWIPFCQADSTMAIKAQIDKIATEDRRESHNALAIDRFKNGIGVGGGTETGLWWGLHDLTTREIHVDRIILLSDLCCYTQGDNNCGVNMSQYFGNKATVASMVEQYRRKVNANCKVYSINLHGYGQSQLEPSSKNTYLMSGWSESIIKMINDVEGELPSVELPTLEVIRSKYKK